MIWSALILAVMGVAGLIVLVSYASRLKPKLHRFGGESELLAERVTRLQDILDEVVSSKRDYTVPSNERR
ncbi:hypothetical protein [uncultured Tessaracoccus sp.]|uniref:hypothetical protein n=1 Tax=uncultured Tessaracoccus sp. TaxID=905023 RepID=UPI002619DE7C|nr:hypothetical protein [uncultured Tessaracoccus sp.]